ncbi:hypothetical protein CPC08DRAFT_814867 [Agrocybe pediades]|nr:hypothetical protein CPC08DRAFT_814867 [Agrocybe pediades]
MNRGARQTARVVRDAQHVMLRGLPSTTTAQDLRHHISQAQIAGVGDVAIYYKHFRPTGKALLTMVLPDYTSDALRGLREINIPGCTLEAETVEKPEELLGKPKEAETTNSRRLPILPIYGNGPSAHVPVRRSVTISGIPGRAGVRHIETMLSDFKVAKDVRNPVQAVPLPPKKFALDSRFFVVFDSESEAQRFVRKYHMTRYKNVDDASIVRASLIL